MKKKIKVSIWKSPVGHLLETLGSLNPSMNHEFLGTREIEVECEEEGVNASGYGPIDRLFQDLSEQTNHLKDKIKNIPHLVQDPDTVTEECWGRLFDNGSFCIYRTRVDAGIKSIPITVTYRKQDLKS